MAVMVSAIGNGGKVLWPRLVDRIEPQDLSSGEAVTNFPSGVVRDNLDVHPRSLQILRDAMLADVQSSEGTGTARRSGRSENLRQDRHGGSAGCSQP